MRNTHADEPAAADGYEARLAAVNLGGHELPLTRRGSEGGGGTYGVGGRDVKQQQERRQEQRCE